MFNTEKLKEDLDRLKSSDRYVRMYNSKEERMPEASEIIEAFGFPIDLCNLGRSILAQIKDDGDRVEVFSTYVLETKLYNDEVIQGFSGIIGVLVNNTSNKISIYSGMNAHACTNLSIFNPEYLNEINLTSSLSQLNNIINTSRDKLLEKLNYIKQMKELFEARTYDQLAFQRRKGEVLSTLPLDLFGYVEHSERMLRNTESIYHNEPLNDWTLLSSMTDKIKFESPVRRVQSTLALEEFFNNN